ncbi:MAG: DUF3313 family protein [Pseudomonadales bacterium]
MKHERQHRNRTRTVLGVLSVAVALAAPAVGFAASKAPAAETHDGLTLVSDRSVWAAYVDPQADFSAYTKVMILDCYVAFIKDWERHKKTASHLRVSHSDMEKIKAEVAGLFSKVFAEKLEADGGYEITHAAGEDVLLVRPAIIDLDISAPDTQSPGRSRTYTASSGAATLYIELYDSVTGAVLARAIDRKAARTDGHFLSYTNRVTNKADARRALSKWANLLRARLDEFRGK